MLTDILNSRSILYISHAIYRDDDNEGSSVATSATRNCSY